MNRNRVKNEQITLFWIHKLLVYHPTFWCDTLSPFGSITHVVVEIDSNTGSEIHHWLKWRGFFMGIYSPFQFYSLTHILVILTIWWYKFGFSLRNRCVQLPMNEKCICFWQAQLIHEPDFWWRCLSTTFWVQPNTQVLPNLEKHFKYNFEWI